MISEISGATVDLISAALDAAALRHQIIATNIANVGNADYVAKKVTFEKQLAMATERFRTDDGEELERAASEVHPQVVDAGTRPTLDVEIGHLAENVVRYEALLKGLERHMEILQLAIDEGKK